MCENLKKSGRGREEAAAYTIISNGCENYIKCPVYDGCLIKSELPPTARESTEGGCDITRLTKTS